MKQYFTLFLGLIYLNIAFGQDKELSLSLDEAISYALEHNRTAQNANLDIEWAKKKKWETTAIGLPQINAKIDYQNWIKQQVMLLPAEIAGGTPGTFTPVTFGTKQTVNATATLTQLLFDGSYLVGLQSAKVFLQISKNAKEKTDKEIRKATIAAYGNVLLAEESMKIYEHNIALLKNNLHETEQILKNGLTEEENVEQLQITLKQLENGLNNAKRLNTIAYKMLNITLGADLETTVQLSDNLESLANQHVDLALLSASDDVKSTIDYKIAANDKRSKELLLKLERSRALPQLSAFVNGGYNGNNDEFNFLASDQQWFGTSLFGVSLNIPIFSSLKRSAKTQQAKINLEKAEHDLTETEQKLKFELASAKSNYEFSIAQFETTKEQLALAERIEKKNQTKFFEGISSSFDLRQAQQQLYQSQQDYLEAMLNVINQKVALETIIN